jgi:hypothetical protein
MRRRGTLAALLVGIVAGPPASGQTRVAVDGAVSLGYTSTSGEAGADRGVVADVRPGIVLQTLARRLAWRFGYRFAGTLTLDGTGPGTYSNHADASLAAQLTPRSTLTFDLSATQGGTAFQLSQRGAESGQPGIRAASNPALVAASAGQAFVWEASPQVSFRQSLASLLNAPQDDLSQLSGTVTGTLGFDRALGRDAIGGELRSSGSLLRRPGPEEDAYWSITNSVLGRWRRDLSVRWTGLALLGAQQVATFAGSYPLAILPTGGLLVTYAHGDAIGALDFAHGATANLQTGTVAVTDQVTARGALTFGRVARRHVLSASVGYLHADPLGQAAALAAAGTGDAISADAGVSFSLSESMAATLRYSLAYQFGQGGDLEPSLAHVLLVGVTARYESARASPLPSLGRRVDGEDAVEF